MGRPATRASVDRLNLGRHEVLLTRREKELLSKVPEPESNEARVCWWQEMHSMLKQMQRLGRRGRHEIAAAAASGFDGLED